MKKKSLSMKTMNPPLASVSWVHYTAVYDPNRRKNMKKIKKSRRTVSGMLKEIDTFLATNPNSNKLWDILSALRGPDSDDMKVKMATTTAIRRAAFPLTHKAMRDYSIVNRIQAAFEGVYNPERMDAHNHFNHHIQSAVRALTASGREVK